MADSDDDGRRQIEAYLGRVRRGLRSLGEEDTSEILEELRSHILDAARAEGPATAASVGAALSRLGRPETLAGEYATNEMLLRAEVTRSPFRILETLFRWASLSLGGFLALLASIGGYLLGGVCLLCAALKPFHPATAGLWTFPDDGGVAISLRLGFGLPPPGAHELLGWWIVPVGWIVGWALVVLTTRFSLFCLRFQRSVPPGSLPRLP
jgi:hypothetical protein